MLLTEEQAKTKWCPKARQSDEGFGTWNRQKYGAASDSCLCIASDCMAWWRADRPRETVRNYHDTPTVDRLPYEPFMPTHRYPDGWQYSHTDTDREGRKFDLLHRLAADDAPEVGYCGAFGRPGAEA